MNPRRKLVVLFGGFFVLSLIVLFAAPGFGLRNGVPRAQNDIAMLQEALEHYRAETGAYPVGNNFVIIRALTGERDGDGGKEYITLRTWQRDERGRMLDPWGKPYEIAVNPVNGALRIRSAGPDGQFSPQGATDDDIRSWEVVE